jgi:predicted DNA-binding transcriptional regulator YafY
VGPRTRRVTPPPVERGKAVASAAEVAAALLERERRHRGSGQAAAGATTEATVEQLRSATDAGMLVRVVYVNADGRRAERHLAPLDLTAGAVRAVDRDSAQIVTIPLARIASVIPATSRP